MNAYKMVAYLFILLHAMMIYKLYTIILEPPIVKSHVFTVDDIWGPDDTFTHV